MAPPVPVYAPEEVPRRDPALIDAVMGELTERTRVQVPPRDGRAIRVPAGHVLRIACPNGAQVGDLNLFHAEDLEERFYSGKTRAFHGTHVGQGDRLWSCFPYLRPMATIATDTLAWYGVDADGGRVHDVIGTRCDPYTARMLSGTDYDRCCHSNLLRALATETGLSTAQAGRHVHDVLNVFMCTGFDADGRYFMKASPVRAGDYLDLIAEIDLLAVLSTCPGGDCGKGHSSDAATCHPLDLVVLSPRQSILEAWQRPTMSAYRGGHGMGASST